MITSVARAIKGSGFAGAFSINNKKGMNRLEREDRVYIAIDLKSYDAAVECRLRGLDPMTTNLVVADPERGDRTICLAVSPSLRALGVKNRCRVFEIPKRLKYIMAPPRMQKYIDYAASIYAIYLRYFSSEDIFVYSIDEVFIDVSPYLKRYNKDGRGMAIFLMEKIRSELGIRATAGVGSNLYLAKIALDITAKHASDFIGELTEESYIKTLWNHRPLTDFWRIGRGTAAHLERFGIKTMRQIVEANEDLLYREFGIDAELMIDHAYGREPVTIADIKAYRPRTHSICSGQVLMRDYSAEEGELIVREMADLISLDLVNHGFVTDSVTLQIGYSAREEIDETHAMVRLSYPTNADEIIIPTLSKLYFEIVDKRCKVRRINISCNNLKPEADVSYQFSLFDDGYDEERLKKNHKQQEAILAIKNKFGKNAILKGMNFEDAATTRERNQQIGGHKK